jgi:hypothetical protein
VVAAAITLATVWIGWSAGALAQDEAAEAAADPSPLGGLVEVRAEGNDEASAVQKRIDDISDETDTLLGQYRTVLKQIDSINLYNSQMRDLIVAQQAEVGSLEEQLGRVQEVGRSVTPLMLRMIDGIDQFVALDVPFLIEERRQRIEDLHSMMGRADVTTPEKFRQIMEAYQIENEFGRTIEAYRSTLELDGRETTVDLLRFGRIALVYQSLDETQSGRWDLASKSWVVLDGSYRSSIRQGLRIARKQTAPDLIRLPLTAPVDERGAN